MKILVLADSHSTLRLMRSPVDAIKPNAILHLGDLYGDGEVIHEENPQIAFYQVPGNCDKYRMYEPRPEILCCNVCGVRLYMTHGHVHNVKYSRYALIKDARAADAQAVLYGHTHEPDCHEEDGLWVFNPGSCGHNGGSVGLIEASGGQILSCKILYQEDWEEEK